VEYRRRIYAKIDAFFADINLILANAWFKCYIMSNAIIAVSKGITIGQYLIPPFELRDGEIVVVFLYGGPLFQYFKTRLVNIFSGKLLSDNVHVNQPLAYVPPFEESWLRRHLYPVTVGEYLKKNAGNIAPYTDLIYTHPAVSRHTKVKKLSVTDRQLLAMYTTLSNTNRIVFDLAGQNRDGANAIYHVAKEMVKQGGTALLLDHSNDMKNDCSKYIELQIPK
jgi:hypothetical protein